MIPSILDEPSRQLNSRIGIPKQLYEWHPDKGHYSVVRDDDEEYPWDLYEYDAERLLFERCLSLLPPKPGRQKIEPEPETPLRRRFFVGLPNGNYAITRGDECATFRPRQAFNAL